MGKERLLSRWYYMYEITLKARAKINISLDVLRRRPDNYHDVSMIMQTVDLHDKIYIRKTKKKGIFLNVNLRWLPFDERNLAYKAAKMLIEEHDIQSGVYIDLEKKIPVAAGLAGGSSDAATVLIGMNKLFDLGISRARLMEIGKELGADIPYCIMQGTALAEGIGEKLRRLPSFPECYVVLAKPAVRVSTPWVYQNLNLKRVDRRPETREIIEAIKDDDLYGISHRLCNVLEEVTIKKYPVVEEIKQIMIREGALGAVMSGSGPTVFGIYHDRTKAKRAIHELKLRDVAPDIFLTKIYNPKKPNK